MDWIYKGPNKLRKEINELAASAILLYAVLGNAYNLATKTGHYSADIATGRTQPTELEKIIAQGLSEFGKALIDIGRTHSAMPASK